VDNVTRRKLIWGWLRLLLGWLQMSLVAVSIGALLTVGLHPITYVFVAVATAAAVASRLLYHGHVDPSLKERPTDDKAQ
jgi:hypothetical protein